MRFFFYLIIFLFNLRIDAQVTKVKYFLKYNLTSISNYDAYIVITEGNAPVSNPAQRVQFGSQYSFVVPSGSTFSVVKRYMPLKNNINGNGDPNNPNTPPNLWSATNYVFNINTPQGNMDFYGVTNEFTSTFHYNGINLHDTIKLFSLNIGLPSGSCKSAVRLYENNVDPGPNYPGMSGGDFSNGFVIGFSQNNTQDYDGNLPANYGNENVINSNNSGTGSLRRAVECAGHNAHIIFDPVVSNDTIRLLSPIATNKKLNFIYTGSSTIKIKAPASSPAFDFQTSSNILIENIHLIAQNNNSTPRLINNNGSLILKNVTMKDPKLGTANNLGNSILNKGNLRIEGNTRLLKS